ncbi:adenylate/guanylate cyclase domain-containing protein [Sinorhizobium sp. BG8]|uniref:adenylate/guanylate cyclase domain-containing protein n=1 Tax=Sinorhizobium sp. BG8 TaxID=2613773 RepID=UPI00193DDF5C|nr:adenylate/guanylate cyclase domain-containing protein [Sinorhizobium sp. BG8]QRM56209.1 HAMP domain-containing protein [Sinorhizobium sp. BG8]
MNEPAEKTGSSGRMSSLRSLFSAITVLLLVAVSGTLVGLAYIRGKEAAIERVNAEMHSFSDRLVGRLEVLSGDTTALVGLVASVANSFLAPPTERMDDKVTALREALARSPHIDGLYAGYPDGSFFQAVSLRDEAWRSLLDPPDGATLAIRAVGATDQGKAQLHLLFFDADGKKIGPDRLAYSAFDPRTRPWYRLAVDKTSPVAFGPYAMYTTGALGVSISQAHKGNGKIVIGADVVLNQITDFLRQERLTPDSIALVADNRDKLILHSDPVIMNRILSSKLERDLDDTVDSDPLMSAMKRAHPALGTLAFIDVNDRTYVVMATAIESALLFSGYTAVIAAPLDELMASANRDAVQGLTIAGTVVLLAIACALVLARMITQSLRQLTASANRLQNLDFSTPIDVSSRVREISTLGNAMNRARDAIFSFALYVPKELVRRGMESGEFSGRTARRQEVTALFTDIYDFTTISERHAPEEVVSMLSEYFDILNEAVKAEGGTIIQFLGDSIFAMWNAPAPDERHAEKACRCALSMEGRLEAFNAKQKALGLPAFRTRFGIHTGPAVVGSVGARDRLQYTAMGDTINVASRLEGLNKTYGTEVLASAAVVAQCGGWIRFRPLGEVHVKGRETALEVFEVVGAKDDL